MASAIYGEFESMMGRYDADVVKNLMPLVVNVLENMDLGYTEKQVLMSKKSSIDPEWLKFNLAFERTLEIA